MALLGVGESGGALIRKRIELGLVLMCNYLVTYRPTTTTTITLNKTLDARARCSNDCVAITTMLFDLHHSCLHLMPFSIIIFLSSSPAIQFTFSCERKRYGTCHAQVCAGKKRDQLVHARNTYNILSIQLQLYTSKPSDCMATLQVSPQGGRKYGCAAPT